MYSGYEEFTSKKQHERDEMSDRLDAMADDIEWAIAMLPLTADQISAFDAISEIIQDLELT